MNVNSVSVGYEPSDQASRCQLRVCRSLPNTIAIYYYDTDVTVPRRL